jgi:predicted esterase
MAEFQRMEMNGGVMGVLAPPEVSPDKVAILIHGWTGDETSMSVFAKKLGEDWLVAMPRAPFPTADPDLGGYSWVDRSIREWPVYQDFLPGINWLKETMDQLLEGHGLPSSYPVHLSGFSQGAAAAVVYAAAVPKQIVKLALLAGFIPDLSEGFFNSPDFKRIDVFIAHGEKDETVPVSSAQKAKDLLDENGNQVQLCLSDVGHRLGKECFEAFSAFMTR